jgi:hypothetical protein
MKLFIIQSKEDSNQKEETDNSCWTNPHFEETEKREGNKKTKKTTKTKKRKYDAKQTEVFTKLEFG